MKKISFLILGLFLVLSISAQDNAYYKNKGIEGKKGADLKTALHVLIHDHYDVGYDGLFRVYETSDNKDGRIWDMYSTCNFSFSNHGGYSNVCDSYNREHMIPQSWFSERSPMVSDAHHVFPTDGKVNGARSNYPHAETNAAPLSQNKKYGPHALGAVGECSVTGYAGKVYEPIDEYKGDIARTYFYFATCYEGFSYSHQNAIKAFANNKYPGFQKWFIDLLMKWHRQDSVSQKEIVRNDAVYVHQHNRNPFIDYPELAEHIWGNKQNIGFQFDGSGSEGGNEGGGNEGGGTIIPDCTPVSYSGLNTGVGDFTTFSVAGEQGWSWSEHSGKQYAKISGFLNGSSLPNEDWLISPSFNLSKMKSAQFSFSHIINFANASTLTDDMTVWVSSDYVEGNPTNATWQQITGFTYPKGNSWNEVVTVAPISLPNGFMRENVHIAFKYVSTSTYSGTWEVYGFNLTSECNPVTSVEQVIKPEYDVLSAHNSITIINLSNNSNVILRDICGRVLYHDNITSSEHTINVPQSGIYLLSVNNKTTKVVVY